MRKAIILGVILARGGSKGIPKKNIFPINGHPLISYTIAAALKSGLLDKVVVSTDSEEIAEIARQYGAEVPFIRPEELAGDEVPSNETLRHAVIESEKVYDVTFEYVIEMPCVSPLRDDDDIRKAVKKLIDTDADSVISVTQMQDKHPVRMKRIVDDRLKDFCMEFPEGESGDFRRQSLEPCFIRNGAIYSMKRDTIVLKNSRWGEVIRPYIMPEEKSVNVDTSVDLKLVELFIEEGKCNNNPVLLR
jgi:CMP-N-acetylneuraminic acid synthetase